MNHSLKMRVISLLLAVVMVVGMLPMTAFATEDQQETTPTETTVPVVSEETTASAVDVADIVYVTVSFDAQGGTEVASQTIESGSLAVKPEDPTYEGYTFLGWYNGETAWNFETDAVSSDLTLVAVWQEAEKEPVASSEPVVEPSEHVHTGGTATCKEQAVCECGESYGELAEHTPSEDGTVCTVCEAVLTKAEHVHTGGTATCKEQAVCECGESYGELADHIPAEDDGDCTTEIVCTVCGDVTTEAAEMHTPNEEGNVCAICGAEIPMILVDADEDFGDGYYSVVSEENWDIAPGIVETELVLNNAAGNHRQVLHIMEADMNNPYTKVTTSYTKMDTSNYAVSNMLVQANWVRDNWGWNVVGAMNSCLSWYNSAAYAEDPSRVNEPLGFMMIDSKVYFDHSVGFPTVLVIHKETNDAGEPRPSSIPKVQMRTVNNSSDLNGWEDQVIPTSSGFIVKEGVNQYKNPDHAAGAPRSVVGIKPDGTVVIMMNDGRQSPYSIGMTMYELAEVMISLGCSYAVNCDGGGSSTFLSQRPGTTGLAVNCSPSDGALRENTSGVLIISTAPSDGTFNSAYISAEYDYYVPNSVIELDVVGLDYSGAAAEIPEEATWALSDPEFGTVADGVFTSTGKTGKVDIQMIYNEKVVGSKTLTIVNPDVVAFTQAETVIPYGKTIPLEIEASYGVFEVGFTPDSFVWAVSNENAGVRDGMTYTATTDGSVTGVVISATYKYADLGTTTLTITFGKGSEVKWNFEDGDISNWMGQEQVREWLEENEIPESGLFSGGNYSEDNSTRTFLSSRTNGGQVKNGKYALGLELDYRYSRFSEWSYSVLFNTEGQTVLRDVANGMNATKLGMWVYIPEGLVVGKDLKGLAMQYQLYGGTDAEHVGAFSGHLLTANGKNLAGLTDADIPEDRWVYFYIDLSSQNYVSLQNPQKQTWREPSFIRFYTQHYTPKNMVFYFDDLTLDYSNAVDDRDPPVISDLVIDVEGNNRRTFNATVSDFVANNTSGLNYASAKIYVDGVALSGVSASGSRISGDAVEIPNGTHTVTFEISDNLGNTAKKSQSFTVAGTAPVTLGGHNDLNNKPEYDSVYYVDINVAEIEKIDSVTTEIDLNTAHLWETEGIAVAEGFTATASVNKYANTVTVTVKRTGECALTGAQTLVSIPSRIYSWRDTSIYTAEEIFATGLCPVVPYDAKVVKGSVTFAEGAYAGYAGVFGGNISVVTNLDDNKVEWHSHTEEAMDDEAATCTVDGYTGRTYCAGCGSVIAWGAKVAATGHSYDFVDGVLKCTCGALFTGVHTDGKAYIDGLVVTDGWINDIYYKDGVMLTGVQKVPAPGSADEFYYDFGTDGVCEKQTKFSGLFLDGELYRYSYMGVLTSGWQMLNNEWYYFAPETMAAVSGNVKVNGVYFDFEETGKLVSGVWVNAFNGYRYYYGPNFYWHKWQEIDGEYYYFEDGLRVTGYRQVITFGLMHGWTWYEFDENGVLQGEADGLCDVDGTLYGFDAGKPLNELQYIDGDYYYFDYYGAAVTGKVAVGTNVYGIPNGYYYFGEDGKMIGSSTTGEIVEIEGSRYYYVQGRPYAAGLIRIDGSLYFVDNSGKIVSGSCNVWNGNGILPEGTYYFGEDGKMVGTEETGTFIDLEDGRYYYKDGKGTAAGLILRDGKYYFAGSNGKLGVGEAYVWKGNGLLREDTYAFGTDGAMLGITVVDGVAVPGEIVETDGILHYYENGKATAAGLLEIDGAYYFAGEKGLIATGTQYVWKGNGIVAEDNYHFGPDGRMVGVQIVDGEEILGEIVDIDGTLYYFVRGKARTAGLISLNGNYYFAGLEGKIATGESYVWQGNGYLKENTYYFADDGKLIGLKEVEDEIVSGEIIELDGSFYYYANGKPEPAGLIEYDGHYYFAGVGGKIATGMVYVWRSNGLIREDNYYFDDSGRMLGIKIVDGQVVRGQIVEVDGVSYYYQNGKPEPGGLVIVDGYYYFAGLNGKISTGEVYVWRGNGLVRDDTYYFDTEGRMLGIRVVDGETVHGEIFEGYYYKDGKPAPEGLIEYEGLYYFADVNGKIATGEKYVWRANGLMAQDTYFFNAEGQMVGIKVVDGEQVSGEIVEAQGGFYYYKNGKATAAGLVVVDGRYYFAGVNGKLAVGESYVWKTNGLLPENTYLFDDNGAMLGIKVEDGKVVAGEIMEYNGALHYIKAGRGQAAGLLYIDGYYYFAGADGKLVTSKDFYVWEANGLLVEQVYTFDAQGRIIG